MALEVNQGGGGGRAGSLTENDEYALDKPYDLYGDLTPDKLGQIDEMFARLFQAVKRAKTAISAGGSGDVVGPSSAVSGDVALFSGTTGKLLSDSGKLGSDLVTGPAVSVDSDVALFNGVTGKVVKSGGSFSALVLSATGLATINVALTIGDVHSLNTVPKLIIPAVVGYVIIPIHLTWLSNVSSAITTSQSANLRYVGGSNLITAAVGTVTTGVTGRKFGLAVATTVTPAVADYSNTGVELLGTVATTGGAGTFQASVSYYLVPTVA